DIAPSECFEDPTFGWICNPGPPTTVAIFDYDSVGNRYVLPSDTFAVGHRIRRFNGCYYSNDYDGNITSRTCGSDVRLYTYYGDSKLKSVTVNGVAANYYYDSQGRLLDTAPIIISNVSAGHTKSFSAQVDSLPAGWKFKIGFDNGFE
ncbi:MAG: hypothetical protein ACE5E1_07315, partial [Phycisphaerae bacterium]